METNFIPLESIQIATPCRADWDKMTGDDQARFCGSCAKNVYNLSAMTREQAQLLIQEKEGHLCVQLHRRADGTVITSDCPVGISPLKRSPGVLRTLMATTMAALLAVFGSHGAQATGKKKAVFLGGRIAAPAPQPKPTVPAKSLPVQRIMGRPSIPLPTPVPTPKSSSPSVAVTRGEMSVAMPKPTTSKPTGPSGQSL